MLPLRASQATLLMGILCIVQGARIVRDTANIPTELFRPVGTNSDQDQTTSNRGNSTVNQYAASEESNNPTRFVERFVGGVEVVTPENDEEVEEEAGIPIQPFRGRSGPRFGFANPLSNDEGSYQPDPRRVPALRGSEGFRQPFQPSSMGFRGSNMRPIFNPVNSFQNTQYPTQNFGRQASGSGIRGPFNSQNNFYRQESYSYSSDGRGPPKIEENVYDSRDPFGGVSMRNF